MIRLLARTVWSLGKVALAFAVAWPVFLGLTRECEDEAARRDIARAAQGGRIEQLADAAIRGGDLDAAQGLVDLARTVQVPVPAALVDRLGAARAKAETPAAKAERCASGVFAGAMTDETAMLCTIVADFTVIGDLRDLAIQGAAWAAGRDYDGVILGLSAVGLGATAVTAASAGTAAPAKAGLSLVKAARRAGHVPPALSRSLATEARLAVRGGGSARLTRAVNTVDDVRREQGAMEAARMLRYAGTVEEIGTVAQMYARFGRLARPVMMLTGKTSIHAFKAGYKLLPTLLPSAALLACSALLLALGLALRGAIERRAPDVAGRARVEPVL